MSKMKSFIKEYNIMKRIAYMSCFGVPCEQCAMYREHNDDCVLLKIKEIFNGSEDTM